MSELNTQHQPATADHTPKKQRSDKGPHRKKPNGKTAGASLSAVIEALDGLSREDVQKVLSAASIFAGVAKFEGK